jgi:hypothetical protein
MPDHAFRIRFVLPDTERINLDEKSSTLGRELPTSFTPPRLG